MPTLGPDVIQVVESTWADEGDRESVLAHLAQYGEEPYEREAKRVLLAVLKLSEGRSERIVDLIRAAKHDYRDVLMWAEYPEEATALWALRPALSPEEVERLDDVRRRDKARYQAWVEMVLRPPRTR